MEEKETGQQKEGFFRKLWKAIRFVFRAIFIVLRVMFKTLFILCVIALLVLVGVGFYKIYPMYQDYRSQVDGIVANSTPEDFRLQEASFIYDVNGDVLAKLTGDEDSSYLTYDEIPEAAVNAFVAIEDRTFWDNSGIDIKGIFRVAINYFRTEGEEKHGASTITQQLARGRFLTREVSLERKAKEMLIAMDLTKKYTKEQIMEFYINDISFANTYYGLQAAARGYFGKDAGELTLSQIAYLCAIPNSPTYYNPYNHPENALKRRDKILDDMRELGYITEEEYNEAVKETITVERQKIPMHNYETTYAIECAVRYLMRMDGFEFQFGFLDQEEYEEYKANYNEVYQRERDALYTGGYHVYTSLDPAKQQILQDSLDSVLTFDEATSDNGVYALQGAATVIDNHTRRVVAIVGGRTQETDTYTLNRAFQSPRQPGSTIKPLVVYTPALENGYRSTTMVRNINVSDAKKKGAVVSELPGEMMPLRRAVELSRNGVAWYIFDDLTPSVGMNYLTQMRFDSIVPTDFFPASALGGFTYGATTEEMAGAYSALASGGLYQEPTCLIRIVDNQGNDIFQEYPAIQVYHKNSANLMVDILKGVITSGTASSMGWKGGIEAAGKTGTTNENMNGWFCGMTPYYTISVWVGYDQPKILSNLYGATYPASIWKGAMVKLVEGLPDASFAEAGADTGVGEGGEYLPGHDASHVISAGYTVADFRSDHQLADSAQYMMDEMKSAGYSRRTELRAEAESLIGQIKSESMKARMKEILATGNAGGNVFVTPPEVPVEDQPAVEEPAPIIEEPQTPLGPSSDTTPRPNPEAPVGPGMNIQ